MKKPKDITFVLRMSSQIKSAIEAKAAEQERSLNAHILYLIKQSLKGGQHESRGAWAAENK